MNVLKVTKVLSACALSALLLSACGNTDETNANEKTEQTNKETTKKEETVTLSSAKVGDKVINDYGTYTIEKAVSPNSSHESGPVKINLQKVMLAKFVPNEENKDLFDTKELNVAVTLIATENTSEDTVNFMPFASKVTTNTQGQYEAQTFLNEGDSEHIGPVKEEFTTAFNLEDENLSSIKELTFVTDGTSKDARTIGEDLTIKVPFE